MLPEVLFLNFACVFLNHLFFSVLYEITELSAEIRQGDNCT